MRLEGSIDAFSLPDIFSLLSMTKKTGGLHLRRAGAHGVMWFTTGALTGGAPDVARESLARRLVAAGLVDDDALNAGIDRAVADGVGVARGLQLTGGVDEAALHDVVGEHIVDTVFDLLRWPDGDFAFVVDEANPDDVGVSRPADEIVTEARRRLEVWGQVAVTVPSPQTVLSVAATPADDPQLTRDEWSLLAMVDGRRSVAEIVGLCGRGEYAVVSTLADLVGRGLLRTDDEDGVAALMRRHEMLTRLESRGVEVPAQPTAPESRDEPTVVDSDTENDDGEDDEEDSVTADASAAPEADVRPMTRPAGRASGRPIGSPSEVTPKRPEPFLPPRQPAHPEEPAPVAVAAAGGSSPSPATVAHIERDPSVNKSLLLRLIAGVRGL